MPRLKNMIVLLVTATLVGGCVARPAVRPSASVPQSVIPATRDTVTTLHAGETRQMLNGLSFTVPAGWEGTATVYGQTAPFGPTGLPTANEYVVLHLPGATGHPSSVMLYSAVDIDTLVFTMHSSSPKRVLASPGVSVWMGAEGFPSPPMRLYLAVTSVPGKLHGGVFYGGSVADPAGSTQDTWRLIRLTGAIAPPRGAFIVF